MSKHALCVWAIAAVFMAPDSALAWTRPGHSVTAAIAWDDLAGTDRGVIEALTALLPAHPDRGPFEVAAGRATGDDRTRRLALECARWPDDARGTLWDHPTWHYAFRPLVRAEDAPPAKPKDDPIGDAQEAFALNVRVLANGLASDAERAVALCWVMHLVGDIHQPLHTAQLFSAAFPNGDRGGTLQFVKDPQTGEAISLHWFWDDAVNRAGEPEAVVARARELETGLPRANLEELGAPAHARDFAAWAAESHALATSLGYRAGLAAGASKETAAVLPADYVSAATQAAERRAVLAGHRLADVLREALGR
jgi:hypothetical protein